MLELGATAPDFDLPGTDGTSHSLASFARSPVLVVVFSCNHCPYVKAYEERMVEIQKDYAARGVQLVAVNSNDESAYSEDSFEEMVKRAREKGFNFPYLRDKSQTTVESYGAVCTPHVFAFDGDRKLRYRGRIDDSKDPANVKSPDLRNALDDLVSGHPVRTPDTRPFGCSIKWFEVRRR
jgi:peroxiredoxin